MWPKQGTRNVKIRHCHTLRMPPKQDTRKESPSLESNRHVCLHFCPFCLHFYKLFPRSKCVHATNKENTKLVDKQRKSKETKKALSKQAKEECKGKESI